MRIKKKTLGFIFALFVIFGLFSFYYFTSENKGKDQITCSIYKDRLPNSDCGIVKSDQTTAPNNYSILGRVVEKYEKDGEFYFVLKHKNSLGKVISSKIQIAPKNLNHYVTTLTTLNEGLIGKKVDPLTKSTNEELFKRIQVNREIVVNIFIPGEDMIAKAKTTYGDLKIFSCSEYFRDYKNYLEKSTTATKIKSMTTGIRSGCNLYTFHIATK